jgi:ADP-ribosylglycohydrolase/DNA-binding transcriptional regulator YhcF (GntR family)
MYEIIRPTLPVLVAEEIRRTIIQQNLKPGEKLPAESELAKTLGVGRPTIREALRILEGEKLVRIKFGHGASVMANTAANGSVSDYYQREGLLELLGYEVDQLVQEGRQLDPVQTTARIQQLRTGGTLSDIQSLYGEIEKSVQKDDFPYIEPDALDEIHKEASHTARCTEANDRKNLPNRLRGALIGRCVGCILGKPVEGWSKDNIEKYLQANDRYPLRRYFPYSPAKVPSKDITLHRSALECTDGNIQYAPRDDDIDYLILNLGLLERHGFRFTTEQVGEEWLRYMPYELVYTAERQAYSNLVKGLRPPVTASYLNPFREWIGAQIRADVFGYVAPGNPALAASLALRDARLSHTKNGLYGEMFVAACIAAALVSTSLTDAIDAGLAQVPQRSRLAETVRDVLAWSKKEKSWERAWQRVMEKYGHLNPIHTLNNLAFVLLALLYGELDFRNTITIAVMCGLDTDCNGATAGSILGSLLGIEAIPKELYEPFHGRVRSALSGQSELSLDEITERIIKLALAEKRFEVANQ